MKLEGVVLLCLGAVFIVVAGINASTAPNVSYLVGTFLPGVVCLILGLKLGQRKMPKLGSRAEKVESEAAAPNLDPGRRSVHGDNTRSDVFQLHANVGVGCGILLMFLGGAIAQSSDKT